MKKLLIASLCFVIGSLAVFGQTSTFKQVVTDHYKVASEVSEDHAQAIASKMEAALAFFNQLLHFDLSKLPVKFRVTIYKEKTSFDSYLKKVLGLTRDDFVYIHYSDLSKCELVGFDKSDEADLNVSLLHQGCIQFIKAFIPNIPIWISDGIAAYLENATFTPPSGAATTGTFTLNLNLGLLDAFKAVIRGDGGQKMIPLEDFLTIDRADAVTSIKVFYPEAWAFIYFLLSSPAKNHTRILWDSLGGGDPTLSIKDNSVLIKNKIFMWIDKATLEKDFIDYITNSKTFNDLLTDGLAAYNNNDLKKAAENFRKATELKPGHYFPQYYLGLISYEQKDYDKAEAYYLKALDLGMEKGLANYALGVNAYANNKYDNATKYLKEAANQDAKRFGDKTDALLKQIDEEVKLNEEDKAKEGSSDTATIAPTVAPTAAPTDVPTAAPTTVPAAGGA